MGFLSFSGRRVLSVMVKEFRQLGRDRPTLAMMVMIPLIQLTLFGFAINTDPKHMPTTLLMRDDGPVVRSLIAGFQNSGYFSIKNRTYSEKEAYTQLQEGLVQFVITFPENFSRNLVRGFAPSILIEADATDPTASSGALAAVSGIVDTVIRKDLTGPLAFLKAKNKTPFNIEIHKLYNPEGFSDYNIVPGLMGVILTMTGVMMTALALTRERERGTMETLLAMPVKPFEIMAGKIAPYMLIAYAQAALVIGAAKFLFGVPIIGSLFLLGGVLLAFIICNLALGFTVSTAARNQMQAMQFSFFIFLPSIMLSGFIFPFRGMPAWAQDAGSVLPATYFIRIVRGVLLKGNTFVEVWPNLWPLLVFMCVTSIVAMKVYRTTLD